MPSHPLESRPRLGVLLSHPVQYISPWLRELSTHLPMKVYYVHRQTPEDQAKAGFNRSFDWNVPLLDGYDYAWLSNAARRPGVDHLFGCDVPDIDDILADDRPDAVLVFGWRHKCVWQTLRACRRLNIKVLARGDSTLEQPRSLPTRLVKRLVYPSLLQLFDAHLYVGRENRRYLEHYKVPNDRLYFVPHVVDNDWFAAGSATARARGITLHHRKRLGIEPGAFVFLYVGKLTARKGVCDFLNAFLTARRRHPREDIHAIFIGDGPMRRNLLELSSKYTGNVHFPGFRNQRELPGWYAMADSLVLPGCESWGLVVNEAAACGLPALVSDRVGCRADMIDEGATGLIFPHGDVEALTRKLQEMHRLVVEGRDQFAMRLQEKCRTFSTSRATQGLRAALGRLSANAPTIPHGHEHLLDPRAHPPLVHARTNRRSSDT